MKVLWYDDGMKRTVVLCGSKRFKPQIRKFASGLRELGVVVLEPHLNTDADIWDALPDEFEEYALLGIAYDHFQKIRVADVVFFYNKDGYMGNSCTLELGFATACSKMIYALEPDGEEVVRGGLIRGLAKTPGELVEYLK